MRHSHAARSAEGRLLSPKLRGAIEWAAILAVVVVLWMLLPDPVRACAAPPSSSPLLPGLAA